MLGSRRLGVRLNCSSRVGGLVFGRRSPVGSEHLSSWRRANTDPAGCGRGRGAWSAVRTGASLEPVDLSLFSPPLKKDSCDPWPSSLRFFRLFKQG